MEFLEDKIQQFLAVSYGDGDGNGYGYGYGNGYGNGDGNGNGDGDGNGNGDGDGNGNGNGNGFGYGYGYGKGNGISEINEYKVYMIDETPTILVNVHGNLAQGFTLRGNVVLVPCYVAKVGNFFAHGDTAHEALRDATAKYEENKPLEERIADAIKKYPTLDTIVPHKELYSLHHVLTGSCKFGRDEFAKAHNLDPHKGEMTMQEFIELTRNAYGGDAIRQLEKGYEKEVVE